MAIATYRSLLRSIRIAFEGDSLRLQAARKAARDGFILNREVSTETPEYKDLIAHAEGVSTILRSNIVQGRPLENQSGVYKLNIHKHTERGDNDSIKNPPERPSRGRGRRTRCCSS